MAQKIILQAELDLKDVQTKLGKLDNKLRNTGGGGKTAGTSIFGGFSKAAVGIGLAVTAVTALGLGINKTIKIASDFQEANAKMLTTFQGINKEARGVREELVKNYQLSIRGATKLLGNTGDLLTGLGMQREEALKLSATTIKLAADVASFSNAQGGVERVTEGLIAAFTGEREQLKKYGIIIKEADVKTRLAQKGLDKLTGTALQAAKAQVTLEIATKQSKNSIGDLARTSNSYANTQRRLENTMDDLSLALGATFLPIMTKVLEAISKMLTAIGPERIAGVLTASWKLIETWITLVFDGMSNLGKGIMNLFSGNFQDAMNNFEAYGENIKQSVEFLTGGFIDVAKEGYKEGNANFKAFLDGHDQLANDANDKLTTELTQKELKALDKQYENWINFENKKRERRIENGELLREGFDEELSLEQEKIDYLFELGQLTTDQYLMILADRLNNAKLMYGVESAEYFKLQKQMTTVTTDEQKKRNELQKDGIKTNINNWRSLGSSLGTLNKTIFNNSKELAVVMAIINTYESATKAAAQTGVFAPLAIATALATGFAQVAQIRAQAFAEGGLISSPTLGLIGEAGPEIVAPKQNFIDVTNKLIADGTLGGDKNKLEKSISGLRSDLQGLRLETTFDAETFSIILESGDKELNLRTF